MLLKNSSQSLQRPRKGLLSRQGWGGAGALDSHLSQHARPCPCVPTKGACRAGAAPPSCRSTAWGQAQESSCDTDPERGRSPWTRHLEMSKWRGVQENIGFLYGKRGSDLWEPWVSPGSKCLTWAPLALGILGDGPYVVGLSAAGPSSGVPALHVSSLRVHPMGMSAVEDLGVGVSGVWGVSAQLSRCLLCGSLVGESVMLPLLI